MSNFIVNKILSSVPDYIQKVKCDTNESTLPFKCAVKSCSNTFYSYGEREKFPFKFHNFPNNDALCKIWKKKCGWRGKADITTRLKVCSDHFELDDYVRNYKEEFKNPDFKRKLKVDAVPRKNIKINDILKKRNEDETFEDKIEVYCTEPSPDSCSPENGEELGPEFYEDVKLVVDHNEALNKTVAELLEKEKNLQVKLRTTARKIKMAEKMLNSKKGDKGIIHKVFSDAQIKYLLGKKKVYWSNDDLAQAFVLRHIGTKECYLYLKNTLNIPLPPLSCIQKWAASKPAS